MGPCFFLRRAEGGFGASFLREGELVSYRDGKSWVRIVSASFELFFLPFSCFLRKGGGANRRPFVIFVRKKGSDSPFFVILFTESHCNPHHVKLEVAPGPPGYALVRFYRTLPAHTPMLEVTLTYGRVTDRESATGAMTKG